MAARDPEINPAVFFGKELQRARIAAGFKSQDALAVRLGFDRTVITKAESGARPPSDDVLAAWCEACGLDMELFSRLAVLARSGDGPIPKWFETWLDVERDAISLWIWSLAIVTGLLQTAEYARALLLAEQTDTSDEKIDALVTARLERQVILDSADPPHLVIVMDESVLHRLIGSPQVMHDQLLHVADMSERPTIVVQVVPASMGANAGFGGGFAIARTEGASDVLLMEGIEDQTTERRALVRKAETAFDRLRGDALTRVQSRELIWKVAQEWKTERNHAGERLATQPATAATA
jgi:transcriptional regulator with XRE-family HTH domain